MITLYQKCLSWPLVKYIKGFLTHGYTAVVPALPWDHSDLLACFWLGTVYLVVWKAFDSIYDNFQLPAKEKQITIIKCRGKRKETPQKTRIPNHTNKSEPGSLLWWAWTQTYLQRDTLHRDCFGNKGTSVREWIFKELHFDLWWVSFPQSSSFQTEMASVLSNVTHIWENVERLFRDQSFQEEFWLSQPPRQQRRRCWSHQLWGWFHHNTSGWFRRQGKGLRSVLIHTDTRQEKSI